MQKVNAKQSDRLEHLIHAVKNEIVARLDNAVGQSDALQQTVNDQLTLQAAQLNHIEAEVRATRSESNFARVALDAEIKRVAPSVRLHDLVGARITDIDGTGSAFLNYSNSHLGPLADVGLWLNNPVVIEWQVGGAQIGAVNERIVEHPFTFAALGTLPPGSKILDIGGGESTVAFSLASLGHDVTVIEPQGYPFEHPNLTVFERPFEEFEPTANFDAVILLSTIEHFGIGAYRGNPEAAETADLATVQALKDILKPDGVLVLTTPYGPADQNELERTYDLDRLRLLLDGWTIDRVNVAHRTDARTWTLESTELEPPRGPGRVVMLTAHIATA